MDEISHKTYYILLREDISVFAKVRITAVIKVLCDLYLDFMLDICDILGLKYCIHIEIVCKLCIF